MNRLAIVRLTCVMLCLCGLASARADVMDSASTRSFSLGAGKTAIVLGRGDWLIVEEKRGTNSALKYRLESEQIGAILTIEIGTATVCGTPDQCLDEMLNRPDERRKDVERFRVGSFSAVQYHIEHPSNLPVKASEVQALATVGGSTFDVRIVKFSSQLLFGKKDPTEGERSIDVYPDMTPLTNVIKSLAIRQ